MHFRKGHPLVDNMEGAVQPRSGSQIVTRWVSAVCHHCRFYDCPHFYNTEQLAGGGIHGSSPILVSSQQPRERETGPRTLSCL